MQIPFTCLLQCLLKSLIAVENLEHLYQRSIEPKPTAKEAAKPKVGVKAAKKEYLAFDANPRVAKAFLERVKAGKDYETGHLGRPIYEEEENHGAIHFPQVIEQYTPWKHVEDHEERTESPAARQISWADKLRKKPSLANGSVGNKLPKGLQKLNAFSIYSLISLTGPIKPKLVAKSGTDNSPWKVQKNAPTVSATEVPTVLRPMMSCALWRIHESVHRNDENQLFVLTDQRNISEVAEKLNIRVCSEKQLRETIATRGDKGDLNTFGELEREFGIQPAKDRTPVKTPLKASNGELMNGVTWEDGTHSEEIGVECQDMQSPRGETVATASAKTSSTDREAETGNMSRTDPNVSTEEMLPSVTLGIGSHLLEKEKEPMQPDLGDEGGKEPNKDNKKDESSITLAADGPALNTFEERPSEGNTIMQAQSQPPANNIWSRSFADALTGNTTKKTLPVSISGVSSPSEGNQALIKPPTSPVVPCEQVVTTSEAAKEPEDSDEEVVVFQPKRLSAQKKPPQSSRPSTPNIRSQRPPGAQSPRPSTKRTHAIPKPVNPTQKAISKVSHNQPRPSGGPLPVIDPDAFGRGFAVNTNPHPREGSALGMRSHDSPKPNVKNAVFEYARPVSRPSSSNRQPRTSPARESPKASPQQAPRMLMHVNEPAEKTQPEQMPIGTGRPSSGPSADLRAQMINAPIFRPGNANKPAVQGPAEENSIRIPSAPAKQPPIGSGRPSSKASQQPEHAAPASGPRPPSGPSPQGTDVIGNPNIQRASVGLQRHDPVFVRNDRSGPRSYADSPQQHNSKAVNPLPVHTPSSGRQANRLANTPNGSSLPRARGGPPRPVKPSLFEPSLDHTGAYQPDTFESRKAAVPEVQYVLKSGSTREQVRGKGKLWVG